jgi:hypothetical protein
MHMRIALCCIRVNLPALVIKLFVDALTVTVIGKET